ncbi:MAG: signal peptidase I [Aggregatilineales bacterium]
MTHLEAAPLARPRLKRNSFLRELVETVVLIALVYTLVNLATVRFYIEGPSMQPSFHAGQFLIVSRLHYLFGAPQRGDIVVFDPPGDDGRTDEPLLIKRLIGLPGERVEVRDGRVYINGELLTESYINSTSVAQSCRGQYCDVVLRDNEYFLMGDNRNNSRDSRAFGPVERSRIVGEAIIRYWPLPDLGIVIQHRFSES